MREISRILILLSAGLGTISWSGCSHEGKTADAKATEPPTKVEQAPDANVTAIDHPERFPLVSVDVKKAVNDITATGVVSPDVSRTVPVNSLSGGRVLAIHARLGDDVKKGQLLLTVTSPDMSGAISDYQKFQADERLARTQMERAQLLYSHGAIAQKEVQIAEETEDKAKVDAHTSGERVRILGGSLQHLSPVIEVRAPVSGTIVEQNTTGAAAVKSVDNSPNLFTIADLSRIWVLCDVYENNLAQVHVGDPASIELNAYPNRRFQGRVSNISQLLDPATRSAKVRVELANPNGLMKQNMFATVHFVSRGSQNRMVLPVGAILRLQDRDWVFRRESAKQFRRAEVQTGPAAADGSQQVLSGVNPGDVVAANALEFSRASEKE